MTFSKKNHSTPLHSTPLHSTPLHSTHSTELFKIFFSLLTLSTAFLQKASGPGKNIKSCLCTTNKCPLDNSKNKSSPKNYKQYCNNEPSIYIGSTKITFETEVRYLELEVILDSKLLLNAHIKFLVKKLKTSVATIKRISANIPKGCLKSVCHTLFESHLILYGISVWDNTSQANIDKLFRLQKRCIRIIFGDREKFRDKSCTAARTRVFGSQSLGASFYSKEHTKP